MDNKIFNVNGRSKKQLLATIKLALLDEYDKENKVASWEIMKDKGFVINWTASRGTPFPVPLSSESITDIIWDWLQTQEAKSIPLKDWDANPNDSDVDVDMGFRVYCEDWGHIGGNHYSIVCIKPACCWYGK